MKHPKRGRPELNSDVSSQSSGEAKSGHAEEEHSANSTRRNNAPQETQRVAAGDNGSQLPSTASHLNSTSRSMFFAEQRELDRDLREIVARVQVQQGQRGQVVRLPVPLEVNRESGRMIPPDTKRPRADAQNSDLPEASISTPIPHHLDPDEIASLNAANKYTEDPPSPDPGPNFS
jgi:hypothetical protein